jgi:hypothetical protein
VSKVNICWECQSTFRLKRLHEGVALCFWCRVKECISNWRNLTLEIKDLIVFTIAMVIVGVGGIVVIKEILKGGKE